MHSGMGAAEQLQCHRSAPASDALLSLVEQERRRQAEYALAVQKQMRDELARQRFDFLQVQDPVCQRARARGRVLQSSVTASVRGSPGRGVSNCEPVARLAADCLTDKLPARSNPSAARAQPRLRLFCPCRECLSERGPGRSLLSPLTLTSRTKKLRQHRQVQAQAKQAHQRREKEFRMAPTTLYPAAIPHGRSALWTDQYNRDVAAMIRDDYLTEIDHKKRLRQQEKDKQVKQERAMLEQIAEGMVLDHVAQQAHKVGMRKELLNELENSKFAHSVPFDSIRPCVN